LLRFLLYRAIVVGLLVLLAGLGAARADAPNAEATKDLSDRIGAFRAVGAASIPAQRPNDEERLSYAVRKYKGPSGKTYLVDISQTLTPAAAYSLLSKRDLKLGVVGAASSVGPHSVLFCKGANLVGVFSEDLGTPAEDEMIELARAFSHQLDGENEIPALVKHLPQWEKVGLGAGYAVTVNRLKALLPNQPILDAVSFEGGVEAVVAHYDAGTLAIVEFNTPQIATTNNYNIATKINDLHAAIPPAGTPSLPTAYRRVGNYAVFVFDAPSQEAANQLIDQVKYEQVVQWLGENPFSYEKATREFTETTLGVLVAVVKTSGLALVTCLAVGGFLGALLFRFRRAQQRGTDSYSDADAMIRLNLDELTPESDPGRLLGRGE
jgi:hypothetical protein